MKVKSFYLLGILIGCLVLSFFDVGPSGLFWGLIGGFTLGSFVVKNQRIYSKKVLLNQEKDSTDHQKCDKKRKELPSWQDKRPQRKETT